MLLNFLQDNPGTHVPSPWKQVLDVEVYYSYLVSPVSLINRLNGTNLCILFVFGFFLS